MEPILYNARFEEFKSPFGAVKTDEEITFNIRVLNSLPQESVYFIIRQDNSDTSNYIYMDKSGSYDDYFIYTCKFKTDVAGLYFYRFEIRYNDEVLFIGKADNHAVIGDWLPE